MSEPLVKEGLSFGHLLFGLIKSHGRLQIVQQNTYFLYRERGVETGDGQIPFGFII